MVKTQFWVRLEPHTPKIVKSAVQGRPGIGVKFLPSSGEHISGNIATILCQTTCFGGDLLPMGGLNLNIKIFRHGNSPKRHF